MNNADKPIRTALRGRHLDDLRKTLEHYGFEETNHNPELVISYGGDGSLLGAERDFPGVPKLPIRDGRTSEKCTEHGDAKLIEAFLNNKLSRRKMLKLEAQTDEHPPLSCLNDIVINKRNIASSVRYRLRLDNALYAQHLIVGDGLVASTPFGSTGYYRSITHSLFRSGIGIAFNNSTEPLDHLVVADNTQIHVEIVRGPAVLLSDNDPTRIRLRKGNTVVIRKAAQSAIIHGLETFRCRRCFDLRYRERAEGPAIPFTPD
ncbi:MAG: hypothetical protein ACOCWJ_03915 [Verrucomicrobiota bacterium]